MTATRPLIALLTDFGTRDFSDVCGLGVGPGTPVRVAAGS